MKNYQEKQQSEQQLDGTGTDQKNYQTVFDGLILQSRIVSDTLKKSDVFVFWSIS